MVNYAIKPGKIQQLIQFLTVSHVTKKHYNTGI